MSQLFQDKLQVILTPALAVFGFELIGCQLQSTGGQGQLLKIFIDKPAGVTVADCAQASHQIKGILDLEKTVPGDYRLEVSSPGLDRPLYTLAHYKRFVGSKIKLRMHVGIGGRRQFTGQLTAVENEHVTLQVDGESFSLSIRDIDRAKLVFEL